jgi:predicted TIM-barrel fold metal-dependent hydrolase
VQPLDGPSKLRDLQRILEHLGSEDILLFSTDYPHWQFEGDAVLPSGFPENVLRKILLENPLATYPRLRETVQ